MNRHKTVIRDGFEHQFFLLGDEEKKGMFEKCKTSSDYDAYWRERLLLKGISAERILHSIQLKDREGKWMNVFKVNFLLQGQTP